MDGTDPSHPAINAVVLNLNGRETVLDCVADLVRETRPGMHTLVVDNGSTDGSVEAIRERFLTSGSSRPARTSASPAATTSPCASSTASTTSRC